VLIIAISVLVAIVSWWVVIEDGPSTAKLIVAVAVTAGAVVQTVALVRRRV
jgi:hypothetical protein